MRALSPRKPRAPVGSRRFVASRKIHRWKLPSGPWTPRQALNFELLKTFARREGHSRVPQPHREGNFTLGRWVNKRRGDYRQGRLSAEQIRAFERLPGWTWTPLEDDFQYGLRRVKAFVGRFGHAAVPHHYIDGRFKLGYWVAVKRIQYLNGRLAPTRVRALEALPGWSWKRMPDRFHKGLQHLRRFVKREGHARVPALHREGSFRLGIWLGGIRRSRGLGKLPATWAKQLEMFPGWTWNVQEAIFERGLRFLKAYVRRTGHARVPRYHLERGFQLGAWVASRRAQFKRGDLSSSRIRALERLPGWKWELAGARFEEGYRHLDRFVARRGHARVPPGHIEAGFRLGNWVRALRRRRTRMPRDQARRLERLPGWVWAVRDAQFEKCFEVLERFVKREGHARVPQAHIEGSVRLGRWVANLKNNKERLAESRRQRLERLPGWAWRVKRDLFAEGLRLVKKFAKREGHAWVPQRHVEAGFPLGQWVSRCRSGKVRLTSERIKALAHVRGWRWNLRRGRALSRTQSMKRPRRHPRP